MKRLFTMVELLVVISIIVILMMLLLPSLSSVRNMSKRIGCADNLQQIGKVFQMYLDDYHDYYPSRYDYSQGSTIWWQTKLNDSYLYSPQKHQIFRCPTKSSTILTIYCYSLNICLSYTIAVDGTISNTPPRITLLKKPSRTSILMDGKVNYGGYDTLSRTNPDYASCSIGFVHRDGTNILYVDGHGEWHVPIRGYGFGPDIIAQTSATVLYE